MKHIFFQYITAAFATTLVKKTINKGLDLIGFIKMEIKKECNALHKPTLAFTDDILSYFSGNCDSPGFFVAEYKR